MAKISKDMIIADSGKNRSEYCSDSYERGNALHRLSVCTGREP